MFYLTSYVVYFVDDVSVVAFQQQCCFSVSKSFTFAGFLQDGFYEFYVVTVLAGVCHRFANLTIVDKFLCYF